MIRPFKAPIAFLAVPALTWLLGCSPLCNDTPGGQARSPDNMIDAITTFRDCGATTSEYTRVTLQPSPTNHIDIKQIIFTTRYRHEVNLVWKGESELTISCPTCTTKDVDLQIVKFRSVEVTYVLGPSIPAGRVSEPLTEGGLACTQVDTAGRGSS
jgi:hypothetical protein